MLQLFRRLGGSSPESVARHATNEERFGPSSKDLSELAAMSFKRKQCDKILAVVEHRFKQSKRHWRQKLKTLTMLHFFIIHGSPQILEWIQQNKQTISKLTDFSFVDQYNVEQGRAVRDKAVSLLSYIENPEKIEEAKTEYLKQRENVRKSIGTGRPSTTSRNTLEMMRDSIMMDVDRVGPLCVIEEDEHE